MGRSLLHVVIAGLIASTLVAATPSASVTVTRGVAYGQAEDCQGNLQTLELDRYELEGDDRPFRPVYVWAHGGFFKYGNRTDGIPESVIDYVRSGWVVLSITYRLCDDIPTGYPGIVGADMPADALMALLDAVEDAQYDMQAAVRWVRRYAPELGFDASRVAAGGFSAGAITALQTAFDEDDPGHSGNPGFPSTVAAAVSHGGGYVHGLMGSIDPGEPPIAMIHGTHDTTVPMAAAVPACTQTTALLNVCEFTPVPGEGHGILRPDVALDFLRRHVLDVDRTGTSLTITDDVVRADGTVELTVRLRADSSDPTCALTGCEPVPLEGRRVRVAVGDELATAVTDADGTARVSVRPTRSSAEHDVVARYHGEPDLEPALATTTVRSRPGS